VWSERVRSRVSVECERVRVCVLCVCVVFVCVGDCSVGRVLTSFLDLLHLVLLLDRERLGLAQLWHTLNHPCTSRDELGHDYVKTLSTNRTSGSAERKIARSSLGPHTHTHTKGQQRPAQLRCSRGSHFSVGATCAALVVLTSTHRKSQSGAAGRLLPQVNRRPNKSRPLCKLGWKWSHPRLAKWALAAMAMREQMRVAMAHLAHTASQLSGDMNAGYIDYDEVDDRRGCRPVDSSDSEQEENFDCGDVSALVFTCLSLLCARTISFFCTIVHCPPCLAT
jgi:hypothetical protein